MATDTIAKIALRVGTAAQWTAANPVLLLGEVGIELDPPAVAKIKVGDGATAWSSLNYAGGNMTGDAVVAALAALTGAARLSVGSLKPPASNRRKVLLDDTAAVVASAYALEVVSTDAETVVLKPVAQSGGGAGLPAADATDILAANEAANSGDMENGKAVTPRAMITAMRQMNVTKLQLVSAPLTSPDPFTVYAVPKVETVDISFDTDAKAALLIPFSDEYPTWWYPTRTQITDGGKTFSRFTSGGWARLNYPMKDGRYKWLVRISGTATAASNHQGPESIFRGKIGLVSGSPACTACYSTGSIRFSGTLRQRYRKVIDNVITDLYDTSVSPANVAHGAWFWQESEIVGSSHKFRYYAEGGSEPSWVTTITDATIPVTPGLPDAGIGFRNQTGINLDVARVVYTPASLL